MRERHGPEVVTVGFTTYDGTVTAATGWGDAPRRRRVRPARPGSVEHLLHETGLPAFLLALGDAPAGRQLAETRLERAIGVIYRPDTERASHYFAARMGDQFDMLVHVDRTTAVHPLERGPRWDALEPPDTYPTAL
jgi:erythromycin esterase-like protein